MMSVGQTRQKGRYLQIKVVVTQWEELSEWAFFFSLFFSLLEVFVCTEMKLIKNDVLIEKARQIKLSNVESMTMIVIINCQ